MHQATILPSAQRDIDDIAAYLAGDNAKIGLRFLAALHDTGARLLDMPRVGREFVLRGLQVNDLRCCPIGQFPNYLIFYRPTVDGVEIIRVLHGARDVGSVLADELGFDNEDERPANRSDRT